MTDFADLIDLAAERLGGTVLAANDEFFAPKESLLKAEAPIFLEGKYTDRGKWMDGWETRRRREPGHDWCLIRLGLPGRIQGVVVDTKHFKGNYPEACSIEGCHAPPHAEVEQITTGDTVWTLLASSQLQGHASNRFEIAHTERFTHVRFNIFPDGGVARLRVFGTVLPDWERILRAGGDIDLAAVAHGGLVVAASDMFFGSQHNLIMPGRGRDMSDGWETRRRRGPGHDWVIVQLGRPGAVHRVAVDTTHFKGNAPESCSIDACHAPEAPAQALTEGVVSWAEILPRTKLQPHTVHLFDEEVQRIGSWSHVRLNIYPDGGVSRLRLYGRPHPPDRGGLELVSIL
jgi:allantoicase